MLEALEKSLSGPLTGSAAGLPGEEWTFGILFFSLSPLVLVVVAVVDFAYLIISRPPVDRKTMPQCMRWSQKRRASTRRESDRSESSTEGTALPLKDKSTARHDRAKIAAKILHVEPTPVVEEARRRNGMLASGCRTTASTAKVKLKPPSKEFKIGQAVRCLRKTRIMGCFSIAIASHSTAVVLTTLLASLGFVQKTHDKKHTKFIKIPNLSSCLQCEKVFASRFLALHKLAFSVCHQNYVVSARSLVTFSFEEFCGSNCFPISPIDSAEIGFQTIQSSKPQQVGWTVEGAPFEWETWPGATIEHPGQHIQPYRDGGNMNPLALWVFGRNKHEPQTAGDKSQHADPLLQYR